MPAMAPTIDNGIVQFKQTSKLRLRHRTDGRFSACMAANVEDRAFVHFVFGLVRWLHGF